MKFYQSLKCLTRTSSNTLSSGTPVSYKISPPYVPDFLLSKRQQKHCVRRIKFSLLFVRLFLILFITYFRTPDYHWHCPKLFLMRTKVKKYEKYDIFCKLDYYNRLLQHFKLASFACTYVRLINMEHTTMARINFNSKDL